MTTTGQGRKTDPVDARSVAVVALRTPNLQRVQADDTTGALRLLVDRRDQLGRARTELLSYALNWARPGFGLGIVSRRSRASVARSR